MRAVAGDTVAGALARRLIPAACVVPALLAVLREWGERAGLYGPRLGLALLVGSTAASFAALVWWAAAGVRSDGSQRRAGLAIENARLYDQLEHRVRERTTELEATNQELEAFSYSVAHDLRAPLRAVSGYSHAVLEDCADRLTPGEQAYLRQIQATARSMSRLVDDLLDLARVGRMEVRRTRVDLSETARGVVAKLAAADPDRDVEIVIEPELVAHADPRLIEIALTNLLGNAWKFTRKRARARIELAAVPGARPATYLVRDNGAGFDPARAGKLFQVFQRLHEAAEFEGTGIGLATVQRVVQRHAGRIWADGAVDHGATFYFTLEA
jgi:light-regulated signal transduction histidine kinase (bacteriophytochrome)